MAHMLDIRNGKASIAFLGSRDNIWHKLGTELTEDADIDTWKIQAGMNWNINHSQVTYDIGDPEMEGVFEGKRVLFRSDTKEPLSIVSDKYNIVQPGEVLEFFRDLTEDLGMKMSTAGCLFDGRKFWGLADTGEAGKILGKDEIKGYLLLTSSCDGSSPTVAQLTSMRVVCANTLRWSLENGSKTRASVRHRKVFSPDDIKRDLGLVHGSWDTFMESINCLSSAKITDKVAREFIRKVIIKDAPQVSLTDLQVKKVDSVMNLYHNGMGADVTRGTAWGALCAVTEYVDHHSGGRSADTKMWNSFQGQGSDLKVEAFEKAQELWGV